MRASVLLLAVAACTPPIRQFDLNDQRLTCQEANDYAFHTLQSMGFAITAFDPASVGHPGQVRGTRTEAHTTQSVTVTVTCTGTLADLDASEDGKLLGQLEFKRAFYLGLTGFAAQHALSAKNTAAEAERPLEEKKEKGLQVMLEPVQGLGSKLDFDLDLAAGGVLPVRVTIKNVTGRTYALDPTDVVLAQKDGTRVRPITVADAAQRVADALRQKASGSDAKPLDAAAIVQRLQARLLTSRSAAASQTVTGYLFFPLAQYTKGRITLEDQATEEEEGFVVEF
ncbi:MAG TPA: hypothetical protein VN812_13570 [Candidatus Acidoferrales bacterium]|nr:hypothetical protein [Candidatus Acidoferrales bacterium]